MVLLKIVIRLAICIVMFFTIVFIFFLTIHSCQNSHIDLRVICNKEIVAKSDSHRDGFLILILLMIARKVIDVSLAVFWLPSE